MVNPNQIEKKVGDGFSQAAEAFIKSNPVFAHLQSVMGVDFMKQLQETLGRGDTVGAIFGAFGYNAPDGVEENKGHMTDIPDRLASGTEAAIHAPNVREAGHEVAAADVRLS